MHAWHIVCILGAPTSTSHVDCLTVEMYLKFKTRVAKSACTAKYWRCHVRTLISYLSTRATEEVRHMQCTGIMTEQSVCGASWVLSQTVGWSVLHGCGSTEHSHL